MPLDRLECTQCHAVLKPGKPVAEGKKVKCPKCGTIFIAGSKAKVGDAAPAQKGGGKSAAASGKTKVVDDDLEKSEGTYGFAGGDEPVVKPPEPPKPKKRRLRDEDDDDEDDEDEDDDDEDDEEEVDPVLEMYLKQNKSTNPRGPATAMITKPTNFVIITHGLLLILNFIAAVFWIFPIMFGEHCNIDVKDLKKNKDESFDKFRKKEYLPLVENENWDDLKEHLDQGSKLRKEDQDRRQEMLDKLEEMEDDKRQERWIQFIFPPLAMIYLGFVVYGAVQFQSLESYGWAWTSVIMALIPVASAGAVWTGGYAIRRLVPDDWLDDWVFWVLAVLVTLWAILAAVLQLVVILQPIVKDAFFYEEDFTNVAR
jgi:hypothetical protein